MHIPDPNVEGGFTEEFSPLESERFGLDVTRFTLLPGQARSLLKRLRKVRTDIAVVRIPTGDLGDLSLLEQLGADLHLADCLVVYTRDNERSGLPPPVSDEEFSMRAAGEEDIPVLTEMTQVVFSGYRNHYALNPLLRDTELTAGYAQWVAGYVGAPGRTCFIASIGDERCGFATVREDEHESEGVLYGVLPGFRGRGVYRSLIRATLERFVAAGSPRTLVSTQLENKAVQRVWATEDFRLSHSYYTVHINLMRARGSAPERVRYRTGFTVDEGLIERFAAASGDHNPIHMDGDAAQQAGFPGRILHGVAVEALVSAILGKEWPGPGTVILGARSLFSTPFVLGRRYTIQCFEDDAAAGGRTRKIRVVATEDDSGARAYSGLFTIMVRRVAGS